MSPIVPCLTIAAALGASATALAQEPRFQTPAMTCLQTQQLIARAGAIVLGTGGHDFDRYVYHRGFCQPTERVKVNFVPTADAYACLAYTCVEPDSHHRYGD